MDAAQIGGLAGQTTTGCAVSGRIVEIPGVPLAVRPTPIKEKARTAMSRFVRKPSRVIVSEGNPDVRHYFAKLLRSVSDYKFIGEFANATETIKNARKAADVSLPNDVTPEYFGHDLPPSTN